VSIVETSPHAPEATRRFALRITVWRIAAAMAVFAASLFLLFPLGVGADYTNHLARAYIATAIDGSEALRRCYEIDYRFVPNFSIEMIVPRLAELFGLYGAGALLVAVSVVLAPLAGVLLSRTVNGGAGAWLPLLGFATLFNRNLEFGFVNFLFSLGLALLCFCLWVRMKPGWCRSFAIAPLAAFVAANHILGFLFLGYIALLWEGSKFAFGERGTARQFIPLLMIRDGAAFLPGLALIAYGFFIADDVSTYTGDMGLWTQRMTALTAGIGFFNSPLSVIAGTFAFAIFSGGLYLGLRKGVLEIHRDLAVVAVGVFFLVAVMPAHLAGIWALHFRYGGAALILLAAALRFKGARGKTSGAWACAGVLALLALNGATHVARIDGSHQELRRAMASLPDGARLISATAPDVGFEIGVHGASLAVIEADAYVPNLFTNISAVSVTPQMTALHFPQGKPHLVDTLNAHRATALSPAANGRWSENYHFGWPAHFTHLLYMRVPGAPGADLEGLSEIASGADFVLYEIDGAVPD